MELRFLMDIVFVACMTFGFGDILVVFVSSQKFSFVGMHSLVEEIP